MPSGGVGFVLLVIVVVPVLSGFLGCGHGEAGLFIIAVAVVLLVAPVDLPLFFFTPVLLVVAFHGGECSFVTMLGAAFRRGVGGRP